MSDIYDDLEGAAKIGDTLATVELLDKVFTLVDFKSVETEFGERNIATVAIEGDDGEREAWLNGVFVNRQLAFLREREAMPILVTLWRDDKTNSPYVLKRPNGEVDVPVVDAPKAAPPKKGKVERQPASQEAQMEFLMLTGKLRSAKGADYVRDFIARETAKTAPEFLQYDVEGHAKITFSKIAAGDLAWLIEQIKGELAAAESSDSVSI